MGFFREKITVCIVSDVSLVLRCSEYEFAIPKSVPFTTNFKPPLQKKENNKWYRNISYFFLDNDDYIKLTLYFFRTNPSSKILNTSLLLYSWTHLKFVDHLYNKTCHLNLL